MLETNAQEFFELAWERHRIYILKELGCPKPWTNDKIFGNYFFCNVFRKIDKTTKWIIENIIEPNEDNPNLWKTIVLARLLSRIETLEHLKHENALFDYKKAIAVLRERKSAGLPVFTGAFIINSVGFPGNVDKINYVILLLNELSKPEYSIDKVLSEYHSLKHVYRFLKSFPGIGPFMGYEYVTDFSYSERYLKYAPDKYIWMDYGLGAVRGMNRLKYGVPSARTNTLADAQKVFMLWKINIEEKLPFEIMTTHKQVCDKLGFIEGDTDNTDEIGNLICKLYKPFRDLTMREVEHWLCEYDKYKRGGSTKRRYDGGL